MRVKTLGSAGARSALSSTRQSVARDRKPDGEAFSLPIAGKLAAKLCAHRGAREQAAEALRVGGMGDGGAAMLAPGQDKPVAVIGAIDLDMAGRSREGPVLGGVGGELMQKQGKAEHAAGRDGNIG